MEAYRQIHVTWFVRMWPCGQASAHCILYSGTVESSSINVGSKAQTDHLQDILYRRSWLEAVAVQQISSERSGTLKETGRDIECSPLTSRQHPHCCHCEQSHSPWESACASVCTRFECGHSESERPKWKERGPSLHLRSFSPLCAALKILCVLLTPMHGYLSAWGHNAPCRTLF